MTNHEASGACQEIYNGFWMKWRDKKLDRHCAEWVVLVKEATSLLKKYNFPLAEHMITDFIDELEARCR